MEELYFFSELTMWENDLLLAEKNEQPSQKVIEALIDYSLTREIYSPTLNKNIAIGIN